MRILLNDVETFTRLSNPKSLGKPEREEELRGVVGGEDEELPLRPGQQQPPQLKQGDAQVRPHEKEGPCGAAVPLTGWQVRVLSCPVGEKRRITFHCGRR